MEKLTFPQFGSSINQYRDIDFLQMRVETINEMEGDLTGYDCHKCKNRGYSMEIRDNERLVSVECSCVIIRRCVRNMEASGLKNVVRDLTFDRFSAEHDWQQKIKAGAKRFADNPEGFLLFCGQPGSGKTHLCTAVCRELLLRGMDVEYVPWRDEIAQLKSLGFDSEKRAEKMERMKKCTVLYIDDFFKTARGSDGMANPTKADVDLAFEILNPRYQSGAVTIISTEKSLQELVDIDEALGSRIAERSKDHVFQIRKDAARNYRLRGVIAV